MSRAAKADLLTAAAANYEKLNILISELTEKELSTPVNYMTLVKGIIFK